MRIETSDFSYNDDQDNREPSSHVKTNLASQKYYMMIMTSPMVDQHRLDQQATGISRPFWRPQAFSSSCKAFSKASNKGSNTVMHYVRLHTTLPVGENKEVKAAGFFSGPKQPTL